MVYEQVGFVSLKGTCIIRRVPSGEVFILASNVFHWADCKSSFGGKQRTHQKCDLPFFPLFMCIQDTVLLGWGVGKVMSFLHVDLCS